MQHDSGSQILAADRIRQLQQEALGAHLTDEHLRALLRKVWLSVRSTWPWRSGGAAARRVPIPTACESPAACPGPVACDC
jgi:hypothetical protein